MAVPNSNYANDVASTTLEIFMRDKPSDVIFKGIPLWEQLKSKNRIRKAGGKRIEEPLMYAKSTAVGSYSGNDLLDISPQVGFTNADFDWKQYYATVTINGADERKNQGPMAIYSLLDAKWEQARMSLADAMAADIFLDGTGNSSKKLTGLALAVDSAGTYGNISRTANTWWSSIETAVTGVLVLQGSTGLRKIYNDVQRGQNSMQADLGITTQTGFESYVALSDSGMRFTTAGDGNLSYTTPSINYMGLRIVWDQYCQSGTFYVLNTQHMTLVTMEDMAGPDYKGDFAVVPFQRPANQDSKTAQLLWMGNLTTNNCARQGKLTGITNA